VLMLLSWLETQYSAAEAPRLAAAAG